MIGGYSPLPFWEYFGSILMLSGTIDPAQRPFGRPKNRVRAHEDYFVLPKCEIQ